MNVGQRLDPPGHECSAAFRISRDLAFVFVAAGRPRLTRARPGDSRPSPDNRNRCAGNALGSRAPPSLQLDQFRARQRKAQPVRSEVDGDGGLLLDADDSTETVFVVCHQIAHGESLDGALDYGGVEGTSWQVAPCRPGARWLHYSTVCSWPAPAHYRRRVTLSRSARPPGATGDVTHDSLGLLESVPGGVHSSWVGRNAIAPPLVMGR
jgi:hypothetical protein